MKKRWIAALLVACMVFSLCACSEKQSSVAAEPVTQNTEATTQNTEPEKEETTTTEPTAATEETQPVQEETEPAVDLPEASQLVEQVRQGVVFPLLSSFGGAELKETGMLNEEYVGLHYTNVQEGDLSVFFTLCKYCGLYNIGGSSENATLEYALIRPGSEETVVVLADLANCEMIVSVPGDVAVFDSIEMEVLADYYNQEITLPTGYGPNVHPQAYASFARVEADKQGLSNNVFGGEQEHCWQEVYSKIDYATLHNYFSDMMLCGFDINLDYVANDENGVPCDTQFTLHNGTSQIVVTYFADSKMANVFYEPGIDRYLISGAEYDQYIPQP